MLLTFGTAVALALQAARNTGRARRATRSRSRAPSGPRPRACRTSRPPGCSRRPPASTPISLTGKIKKQLLTLHGTLDTLLPISTDSDVYARMVADRHRDRLHRYYRIEGGDHVDSLVGLHPERLRPILPCFRTAFDALTAWTEDREEPPASTTVPHPAGNGATDPALLTPARWSPAADPRSRARPPLTGDARST